MKNMKEYEDDVAIVGRKILMGLILQNDDLRQKVKELQDEADSLRHRNESCTRCDSCVCDKGR